MKVYILQWDMGYEGSSILSIHSSLEGAKKEKPLLHWLKELEKPEWYQEGATKWEYLPRWHGMSLTITEMEMKD